MSSQNQQNLGQSGLNQNILQQSSINKQTSRREEKWNKSQLLLSILLKPELGQYHEVIKSSISETNQTIATGSLTGDIILWNIAPKNIKPQQHNATRKNSQAKPQSQEEEQLQQLHDKQQQKQIYNENQNLIPYQFLIPCLSQSVGRVTSLTFIDNPIARLVDNTQACLMSVHLDNRVRLWDLKDGRCINISPHNIFPGSDEIYIAQPLRQNFSRFFIYAGLSQNIYVFDTWKMKILTHIQISDKMGFSIIDIHIDYKDKKLFALDSKSQLHVVDFDEMDQDRFNIYDVYISEQELIQKQLKQQKLTLKSTLDLKNSDIPQALNFDEETGIISVVYPYQVSFYLLKNLMEKIQEQEEELKEKKYKSNKFNGIGFGGDSSNNNKQLGLGGFKANDYQAQIQWMEEQKEKERERIKNQIKIRTITLQDYKQYLYRNITKVKNDSKSYFLLESHEGSVCVLSVKSISNLFDLMDISFDEDVSYSLGGFSFFKPKYTYQANYSIKMMEMIIRGSGDSHKQQIKEFSRQKGFNLNCISHNIPHQSPIIYSFDIENRKFESFNDVSEFITEYSEKIDIILKCYKQEKNDDSEKDKNNEIENKDKVADIQNNQNDNFRTLISNGFVLECRSIRNFANQVQMLLDTQSNAQQSTTTALTQQISQQISPILEFTFKDKSLGPYIKSSQNIFHPQFREEFNDAFEEQIEDGRVSITLICFINKRIPVMFLGTTSGILYGFPLQYESNKRQYQLYKLKLGNQEQQSFNFENNDNNVNDDPLNQDHSKIGIKYLHFLRNQLIISQENGGLTIISLEQILSQLKVKIEGEIDPEQPEYSPKQFIITDLTSVIINQQKLNMPVKRIQKIKIFESLIRERGQEDIIKNSKQFLKTQFALVQVNNHIDIYSTETNEIEYQIRDSGQGSIYGIFCHCIMDYYVILTSNGFLHFWSMGSGRFERTELFSDYYSIFDLKSLIGKNFSGIENYNNYSTYKRDNNSISECHSIIEFNNRHIDHIVNLFQEGSTKTSTNKHSYESLGDMRLLEYDPKDSLHIIWALEERKKMSYLSQSNVTGMSVLKLKMNAQKADNYYNVNYMLFVDCKKHNQNIFELFEKSSNPHEHRIFSYVPYIYPFQVDKKLDLDAGKLFHHKRPVLQYNMGIIGLANSFSFSLEAVYNQYQQNKKDELNKENLSKIALNSADIKTQNQQQLEQNIQVQQQQKENQNKPEDETTDQNISENQEQQNKIIKYRRLWSHQHWTVSSFLSTNLAVAMLLHFITLGQFRSRKTYTLMLETAGFITKKKQRISTNFKPVSLPILSRFCIDNSYEVMNSASNLMISAICNKEVDMVGQQPKQYLEFLMQNSQYYQKKLAQIQNSQSNSILSTSSIASNNNTNSSSTSGQANGQQQFSISEVIWLLNLTYINIFGQSIQGADICIKRVIQGINLVNCLQNPNLVAPCMKILVEGIHIWKTQITDYKLLLQNLMFIYFHYNTNSDYLEILNEIPNLQSRQKGLLDDFMAQSDQVRKRMKLLTIKTIIALAELSLNDFFSLIKKEIVNVERHSLYPCSVIDLVRNYIKVSLKTAQKHLPFFIEIILRSLDPNNPTYRKICHLPATNALHTIFKIYKNVSFHQTSQKFVVGTQESQILIYDLRTAAKWRVLDGHEGPVTCVAFDNSGKNIASYSIGDSSIRIWKVGSSGFWGSILNMSGKHQKKVDVPKKSNKNIDPQQIALQWSPDDRNVKIIFGGDEGALEFKINKV